MNRSTKRISKHLAFVVALTCLAVSAPAHADGSLYVFLQTQTKPRALQQTLGEQLPGVDVTVFGRFRDFKKAMAKTPADAVLAPLPVLKAIGLDPALQGTKGSETSEAYVLLSVGGSIEDPSSKTIGAVDLLGRKGMASFIGSLLKMTGKPKVKRVTKLDDLLPLLQFKSVDAILLPESATDEIKKKSTLDLKVTKVDDAKVGLAALAVTNQVKGQKILSSLKAMRPELQKMVGVEGWK